MNVEDEKKIFYRSILVAAILAGILCIIPIWQLVIIAGVIAGNFHKEIKRGAKSGAAGVVIFWAIFITYKIITINAYVLLDQFGALLISEYFGWLILLIIILMGAVLGALGGAIGSEARILMDESFYTFLKRKIGSSPKNNESEDNNKET